jgi:hypothetical protein
MSSELTYTNISLVIFLEHLNSKMSRLLSLKIHIQIETEENCEHLFKLYSNL